MESLVTSVSNRRRHLFTFAACVLVAAVGAGVGVAGAKIAQRSDEPTRPEVAAPAALALPRDYQGVIDAMVRFLDGYNRADVAALRDNACGAMLEQFDEAGDDKVRTDAQTVLDERGMRWLDKRTSVNFTQNDQVAEVFGYLFHEQTEHVEYIPGLQGEPIAYDVEYQDGRWKVCDLPPIR